MCLRRTLLACWSSSKLLFLLFFIIYPQNFLSRISYPLLYPHWWFLPSLTMENMWLVTTFTKWEVSARKDGTGIYHQVFLLMTSQLDLGHLLMNDWAHIPLFYHCQLQWKKWLKKLSIASSTIFRIALSSIILELPSKFFGNICSSDFLPFCFQHSFSWQYF